MKFSEIRICKECGKAFTATSPRQFYCKDKHYRPCPICGKPVEVKKNKWQDPPRCCSYECSTKLMKQTNLERYGVEDPGNTPEMIEKRRQHNLEKYGVINAGDTQEAREKSKKTCLEKYGVENAGASEPAKQKRTATNLERYGTENAMSNKDIQQRSKDGLLARYGVDNPRKILGSSEKIQETNIKRYKVPWNISSKEVREKSNETMLQRYGTIYPTQNEEIKQKTKQTNLKRYGVSTPLKLKSTLDKSKQAMLDKYGVEYPGQSKELREKAIQSNLSHNGTPYPAKNSGSISSINKKVAKQLQDIGIATKFEFSIEKYAYDLQIKDTNILLEINPTYTHNSYWNHWKEHGIDKDYHKIKSKVAIEHGYYCIQIFDWDNLDKIIDSMHILYTVDYKNCEIKNIEATMADDFYKENSYTDNFKSSTEAINYGAYNKDTLVAVISLSKLSKYKNDWNIINWCEKLHYEMLNQEILLQYHCSKNLCDSIYYTVDFAKINVLKLLKIRFTYQTYIQQKLHWSKGKEQIISNDNIIENVNYINNGYLPVFDCGYIVLKYKG